MDSFKIYDKEYIKDIDTDIKGLQEIIDSYYTLSAKDQASVSNYFSYAIGRVRAASYYSLKNRRDSWTSYKEKVKKIIEEKKQENASFL